MADLGADPNAAYGAVYSPSFLTLFYDKYVLGFNMRYIWKCSTNDVLLPFFAENFSRNHLDCGVATGWFPAAALARPFRADSKQHLTLLDLTANPLRAAKARVLAVATNTDVRCVEADVTEPPPKQLLGERFDSISMFNLFHCMPGGRAKLRALGMYKELLSDDGVLSGCTVLGPNASTGWLTRFQLRWYNKWWGIFHNWDDEKEHVQEALDHEFEEVETWVIGQLMLFRAKKPRKPLLDV
ncbi:methyltransferase [Colletotrichum higginsianum]|uniref:Methyltransferase n=3 Tax=Colletotrichum destructivum species complex TaxID=2707350 RepID=H1VTW0_COLHI|nr:Methyltransferase [Colletotrichum higginsianum IMI 349063]OBR16380.1 Methyltransferase [Colletotrichum higginsianum IMI 349063]TID04031.1 N-methyltransferase vrtF [Colletotrichum higginsianum]GJC91378.1 methyltransferase [Colletotrichum higginsianum]CCF43668.1 methyltransferase [Colletotrichum higginsianum]